MQRVISAVDAGSVASVTLASSRCNTAEGHARWIDMLTRDTPKRIALVVIAGLAVLAAFCMHGWSSNRARPGEPARSS